MNTLFVPDVERWQAVSLDELNRRAALLDREENKYLVRESDLDDVLHGLVDDFELLTIREKSIFTYDTVYFDTSTLFCYHQHARGRRQRVKIRSRCYVDSDLCFFEVKLKGARGRTIKERFEYTLGTHGTVTDGADAFARDCLLRHYRTEIPAAIRPALGMRYHRLTLVGRGLPERVTIDFAMQFRTDDAELDAPSNAVIVEVKSPNGHGVADAALRGSGYRSESCSKYCVGLNLTRDDLAYNAFNRTLRRHFAWDGRS